jgi:hypothetical protein
MAMLIHDCCFSVRGAPGEHASAPRVLVVLLESARRSTLPASQEPNQATRYGRRRKKGHCAGTYWQRPKSGRNNVTMAEGASTRSPGLAVLSSILPVITAFALFRLSHPALPAAISLRSEDGRPPESRRSMNEGRNTGGHRRRRPSRLAFEQLAIFPWRVAFDYQFITNPAYNRDRGPVSVIAARLRAQF